MWVALICGYLVFTALTLALCYAAGAADRASRKQQAQAERTNLATVIPITSYRRPA